MAVESTVKGRLGLPCTVEYMNQVEGKPRTCVLFFEGLLLFLLEG